MKPFCPGCLKSIVFLDSALIVREHDGRFSVYHNRGCLRKHRGPNPLEVPATAADGGIVHSPTAPA